MWRRGALALCFLLSAQSPAGAADLIREGEYVFRAAGCATCHTDEKHHGAPLAGGRALKTPFGTFYTPNITPDPATGIGRWTEVDFARALREGAGLSGEQLYPAFPYTSYTQLSDADIKALWAYVSSRKPVVQPNRPHELKWYVSWRPLLVIWKMLFLRPGEYHPRPNKTALWNRGAYLCMAAAHCGECHTPRNFLGAREWKRQFAGTRNGPDNSAVPNITPDRKTGIGDWSRSDIDYFLETGMTPDGDYAGGLMADVIDHGLKYLSRDDRTAIATYVLSVPAIRHTVRREKKKTPKDNFGY